MNYFRPSIDRSIDQGTKSNQKGYQKVKQREGQEKINEKFPLLPIGPFVIVVVAVIQQL